MSLGGNALIRRGEKGTIEEQFGHTRACTRQIARLIRRGHRIVLTHGNGPIVGNIVLRNEAARTTVPPMPLYICDADSEGGIGFMIQQTLDNHLRGIPDVHDVVTVITQVLVSGDDPAFKRPTKPIGPFYNLAESAVLTRRKGWRFVREGRRYRRVVPSPRPVSIIEKDAIGLLVEHGVIVIAAGGGGVPVIDEGGALRGVDAVIDKDLATSLLARTLRADSLVILTSVDRVYLHYGTKRQTGVAQAGLAEMRHYYDEGHFPEGSMGPKIMAAMEFLEAGGREVIITSPERMGDALRGRAGTRIR